MKKALFLFALLLLLCNRSSAQNYQSIFGTQSTSWEIRWYNLFGPATSTISVQKDTVVNNRTYKKIVSSNPTIYKGGLLREDRVTGKVWYKSLFYFAGSPDPRDTLERLAFDYSLSKGDTFDISNSWFNYPGMYPDSFNIVDTVYYLNNLKHIEFKASIGFIYPERFTIIEGIGSNLGVLLKQYTTIMQGMYLLCSYKDGVKTGYVNKQYSGSCSITGIPEPESRTSEIKIYPNPAVNRITFENADPQAKAVILTLTLTDLTGRPVLESIVLAAGKAYEADVSRFHPGMYLLTITNERRQQVPSRYVPANNYK